MRTMVAALAFAVSAPILLQPPASAEENTFLPRTVIAAGLKLADCDIPVNEVTELDPEDLGDGLKLVQVSCWRAAYNFGSILFAVDPNKRDDARLLSFQSADGKTLKTGYDLNLPEYDPKTKTLMSFFKGRGVGDCGSIGNWVWTGHDFKLTDYWLKSACDGEPFDTGDDDKKWRVFPRR